MRGWTARPMTTRIEKLDMDIVTRMTQRWGSGLIVCSFVSLVVGCSSSQDPCTDSELESQKQTLRETKPAHADRLAVRALRTCKHADPALKKLDEELADTELVNTLETLSRVAYRDNGGWFSSGLLDKGCRGEGSRLLEELGTSGLESQQKLVEICDVSGQFPVSEDEIVDNFDLGLALQYLMIAGQIGEVTEDSWYGTVAEMVFAAEIPNTPYAEGDGAGGLSNGDIPRRFGGARLGDDASS